MRPLCIWLAALALSFATANQALPWGASGHRMIGEAAIEALPAELPPFLRTPSAAMAVGEFSREPDRSRGAGRTHDSDRDPGHFVDADDQGRVGNALLLGALPPTRDDYEKALRAAGTGSWSVGYLPYSIIADWQQLRIDFAYWRTDAAGALHTTDPTHKAWLDADRARREAQILLDIGFLSHFVGDGSMPLHVSIHFNGWGNFPNPNGYTNEKVHTPWEGLYVRQAVRLADLKTRIGAFRDCGCPLEQRVGAYLTSTLGTVIPFYELEKAGAFKTGVAEGVDFTAGRLAAGAAELRDEVTLAWRESEKLSVGYQPAVGVSDVEAGKVDPFDSLFGVD